MTTTDDVTARGRLVGRDAALAVIGASLADARAGACGLVLVAGEPGVGKTALLAEQARLAARSGARVLRGGCWEGDGAPPYWLWTQVLDELPDVGDAGRLLERAVSAVDPAEQPGQARFRLFEAVAGALSAAADGGPVVVLLDDLQWADGPSVRLLDFLARRLVTAPLLLLGAYRDAEAGETLRELAGTASVLPLSGLDVDGVAALMARVAGPVPDPELARDVHRRCAGNPLFVRELTRLMAARGGWSAAAVPVPDGIRETLRLRLARLSGGCTEMLEIAAVAGSEIRPDLLAAAGTGAVSGRIEEAERARVLVAGPSGPRFAHDLYRETVLAGMPSERRARVHAALGRALLEFSGDGADPAAVGGAARIAAHFVASGTVETELALTWSVRAAAEATARLGHDDAVRHHVTALGLLRDPDPDRRIELLLGLARAQERAGDPTSAREAYLRAAALARRVPDPVRTAEAALGVAGLDTRAGADVPGTVALLEDIAGTLAGDDHLALRSRVLAALARTLRHAEYGQVHPRAADASDEAVALARVAGDPATLARALLARHDVVWWPGTTATRLPILEEMADAAGAVGDADLAAEAVLLRAAALIERGDPTGLDELARYVRLADALGHVRGRWSALSRRATLAQLTGRVAEAVALSEQAMALGREIELPDAVGCYATLRGSLATIGGAGQARFADLLPDTDPLWPVAPLLRAWSLVADGDGGTARASVRGFSMRSVPDKYDLEFVAITATVFAAVGTAEQREDAYRRYAPFAGLHALVSGCAAYHGAVDHHLGVLAEASGHADAARSHLCAAVEQYRRLGASAWAEPCLAALDRLADPAPTAPTLRRVDGMWEVAHAGHTARLPDAKGLHDLATLLAAPDRPVHASTLLGRAVPGTADPVLDRRAATAYRARLAELDSEIDEADDRCDPHRAAQARVERDALLAELSTARGLGGRPRRLGDEAERDRKTVTARIRDALRRIEGVHPELAAHLRASVHTGTRCVYSPDTRAARPEAGPPRFRDTP